MRFSQLFKFDHTFRQDVEVMVDDSTLSDHALQDDAERYLRVLTNPSFENINQPAWVRRIQRFSSLWITYTSSALFDSLQQTANELGLTSGKRYVSATICVCASRAQPNGEAASLESNHRNRRIAEALSSLASAWIAHMLWPFFIDGFKSASEVIARPIYLPRTSDSTPPPQSYDGRHVVSKEDLLKRSGYVCFMTGYAYLRAPREFFDDQETVTIADLQVAHIFRPPSAMRERGMRVDDEATTSDILNHYCGGPISVNSDVVEVTQEATRIDWDGVEVSPPPRSSEARNALVLEPNSCAAFYSFGWCLHPSRVANQYHVEVYERYLAGTQYVGGQSPVTFVDHSHKYSSSAPSSTDIPRSSSMVSLPCDDPQPPLVHSSQREVDLPDIELLRAHAALTSTLQLSGAMAAFEAITLSCKTFADEACIPGASGSTFLHSVVEYEGQEVCAEVEMYGIRKAAEE